MLAKSFGDELIGNSVPSGTATRRTLSRQLVSVVYREFTQGWEAMKKTDMSAAAFHKGTLRSSTTRAYWAKVRSNTFCSICLFRRPEHVLRCRHAICDLCARTFGDSRSTEEHAFVFLECLCCGGATNLLIRLKPPTAGVRILSVDGGGVRGIVPLEFLKRLQKSLGASCRIQDLFDLALGTSAGMFLFSHYYVR